MKTALDIGIAIIYFVWLLNYGYRNKQLLWTLFFACTLYQGAFEVSTTIGNVTLVLQILLPVLLVLDRMLHTGFKLPIHYDAILMLLIVLIAFLKLPNGFVGLSDYGSHKVFMLAFHALVPFFTIRICGVDDNLNDCFCKVTVGAAVTMALRSLLNVGTMGFRLEGGEAGVLVTARILAFGCVIISLYAFSAKNVELRKKREYVVDLIVGSVLILLTGTRAALVYAFLAAFITNAYFARSHKVKGKKGNLRLIIIGAVILAVGAVLGAMTDSDAISRVLSTIPVIGKAFSSAHAARSDAGRLQMLQQAINQIIDSRFHGTGTGTFLFGYKTRYPHNILLESLLENGWLSFLFVCSLLLTTLRSAFRLGRIGEINTACIVAVFLYCLLDSMTAGDLGKNYKLWFMCAMVIAEYYAQKRTLIHREVSTNERLGE